VSPSLGRAAYVLAATGTLVGLLVAGCRSAGGCKANDPFCWCPAGASCTQSCSGAGCALYCANGNGACALHGGDRCTASCQDARTCSATCGHGSTIACQRVKTSCVATVGEASHVHCGGAALCDITCTGACDVDCPGGHCRVHGSAGAAVDLSCDKEGAATVCPDGVTRTCGIGCP
jgi:hypothetical protein